MTADITPVELVLSVFIGIALFVLGIAVWCAIERHRLAVEERHVQQDFEGDMAAVELPPWNGDTYEWTPESAPPPPWNDEVYEWTPESLAFLADPLAYQPPEVLLPGSISGPLPVQDDLEPGPLLVQDGSEPAPGYDPAADARAYIAAMSRDTRRYIERLAGAR
jgi:hypothetical protein